MSPKSERKFYAVSIVLTEKEYQQLQRDAIFDRDIEEHLRLKLGLPYKAYGYERWKKENL